MSEAEHEALVELRDLLDREITRRKSLASTTRQAFEVGQWVRHRESSGIVGVISQCSRGMLYTMQCPDGGVLAYFAEDLVAWQPQPGEWCEGTWDDDEVRRGTFVGLCGIVGDRRGDFAELSTGLVVHRSSLRPATPQEVEPASPAKAAPPAQTPAAGPAERTPGKVSGEIPPAPSGGDSGQPTESEQPARAVDPYAEHRLTVQPDGDAYITANRNDARRKERLEKLAASRAPNEGFARIIPNTDGTLPAGCIQTNRALHRHRADGAALDRLAAARSSRPREVVVREAGSVHPRSWPEGACDDAEELFATHGSGR